MGIDIKGGVLGFAMREDAVMAKDNGVDSVAGPCIAQIVGGKSFHPEGCWPEKSRRWRDGGEG